MSRFYFHVRDGDCLIRDYKGRDVEDHLDAIKAEARFVARDLIAQAVCADKEIDGRELQVTDDLGQIVYETHLRNVLRV